MKVRYFAWLKHRTGCPGEEIAMPAGVRTVGDLKTWLAARHPRFGEACSEPGIVKCAVNQEYAADDVPLGPEDEVAFFPPVTGG
jgi:molybdopterin synthase sulfur carrier subunit